MVMMLFYEEVEICTKLVYCVYCSLTSEKQQATCLIPRHSLALISFAVEAGVVYTCT